MRRCDDDPICKPVFPIVIISKDRMGDNRSRGVVKSGMVDDMNLIGGQYFQGGHMGRL